MRGCGAQGIAQINEREAKPSRSPAEGSARAAFFGGATYGSSWGLEQVIDGSRVMAALVPAVIDIMEADIAENPDSDLWGNVYYPRINKGRNIPFAADA